MLRRSASALLSWNASFQRSVWLIEGEAEVGRDVKEAAVSEAAGMPS
jgi:hypothetical protein